MLEFIGALFNFLIRLLAVLLCLLFIVTIIVVLLLVNADSMLLSPTVYENALARERIYERLPDLAATQIYMGMHPAGEGETWAGGGNPLQYAGPEAAACAQSALGEQPYRDILGGFRTPTPQEIDALAECGVGGPAGAEGAPAFFKTLTKDQWASILRTLLPPSWLQSQVESVLAQGFKILEQPGAPLSITVDMREFKNRLTGPSGTDAVFQIIQTLPDCPAGYSPDASNPSQLLECKPSDAAMAQLKPQISKALADATADIPDQLDVLKQLRDSGALNIEALNLPVGPRQLLQVGRWVVRLSPVLCVVLLLIVTLLVVRSWKGVLRWWGYPLLAAGVAVLLTAIVLWVGLDVLVSLGRENLPASVSIDLYDTAAGVLVFITHRYSLVTGAEGIILGLIGMGLVVGSFFVGRGKRAARVGTPPASVPPPPIAPPSPPDDTPRQSGIFGIGVIDYLENEKAVGPGQRFSVPHARSAS
jgi:hypothetical protein